MENQRTRTVGNGEGSLYYSKSLQKWVYQYFYNGEKKTIKQKKNELVKDFKARARDIKTRIDNNSYVAKINKTIYQIGKEILDNKRKRNIIADVTYLRSKETLSIIKRHEVSNTPVQRATSEELQDFADSLQNYANSTISKVFIQLNAIFLEAVKRNYIVKNPMLKVEKPKSKKPDKNINAFSVEEQQAFISQLQKEDEYKDIFTIALYTGMRMGEVLALKVDDIDFKNMEIHIQRTLTKDINGNPMLGEKTKTYAGIRTIPITSLFEKELRHAIDNRFLNINNLIFTKLGKLYNVSYVNHKFNRICKDANIQTKIYIIKRKGKKKENIVHHKISNCNQHMLRHTYATRCIESGMPAEVLQKLLGHKDISTTINTYTTIFNQYKKEQVDKYVEYINALK